MKVWGMQIRPELNNIKYWFHLILITLIVLLILKFIFQHDMLTLSMFWKLAVSIGIADILTHTVLKMD